MMLCIFLHIYVIINVVHPSSNNVCELTSWRLSDTCPMESDSSLNPDAGCSALVPYQESVLAVFHEESRVFKVASHVIRMNQDWKTSGVAAVVWDAAVVLSEYFVTQTTQLKEKFVLELGAGTGLAGITAAKLGAKVTLTDRGLALQNLQANVNMNSGDCTFRPEVHELEWGQRYQTTHSEPIDFIIGADIIYIEETFPLLLNTLESLATPKTEVLLSCRIRYDRDSRFLKMLKEKFEVTEKFFESNRGIYVFSAVKTIQ